MADDPDVQRHLAFFLNALPLGGAERTLLRIAGALAKRGHRIDLLLTRKKGALLSEVPPDVQLVELGKASRRATLPTLLRLAARPSPEMLAVGRGGLPPVGRALLRLKRYLRAERPDALLSTLVDVNLVALWAGRLARSGARLVIREANTLSLDNAAGSGRINPLVPQLVRRWYPDADEIICVSDGVADDLAQLTGIARNRLTTIHNPVDIDRVDRLSREVPEHPWLAAGGPPVLLSAGRLARQKDYPTLLRAVQRVRRQRPVRLVILGEGEEREKLLTIRQELGLKDAVSLPGQIPNPYPHMARADAFVLSSAWEGFPNVLLEALACGCPVVSTDCRSGPHELLGDCARGRLVPVGDFEALAMAIVETLDSPPDRQELRTRARAFSVEATADRYLAALLGEDRRVAAPGTNP